MNRRRVAVAWIFLALFTSLTVSAEGLRSIGVRAVLPMGASPFLLGIEATAEVPLGVLTGSFFLSSGGKSLIVLSYDLRLAGDADGSRTFIRGTTGLSYFDPESVWPTLLLGGGLAIEIPLTRQLALGAAGEFLYPWAFPVPLVSASGRWTIP